MGVPLAYFSLIVGIAVTPQYFRYRRAEWGEWPNPWDVLIVFVSSGGLLQLVFTSIAIFKALGQAATADVLYIIGTGILFNLYLAANELYKKFHGR